ncbi:hypothetical protein HC761_00290 [bacterium]|nr:hypothetical protein [bacterium]
MASITNIDGTNYLDVLLPQNCVGTVGASACGLQGGLPLFGMGDSAIEHDVEEVAIYCGLLIPKLDEATFRECCFKCIRRGCDTLGLSGPSLSPER